MVIRNTFTKPMTSEYAEYDTIKPQQPYSKRDLLAEAPLNEHNLNDYTSYLTEFKPDASISAFNLSKNEPKAGNSRAHILKRDQNIATLMPNTSEFKKINFNGSSQMAIKYSESTSRNTSINETNSCQRSSTNWRIFMGVLWTLSFTAVLILIAMNIVKKVNVVPPKHEFIISKPTNYEIFLLISKNVRRLIITSIQSISPSVN